jgi:hypothetical protein
MPASDAARRRSMPSAASAVPLPTPLRSRVQRSVCLIWRIVLRRGSVCDPVSCRGSREHSGLSARQVPLASDRLLSADGVAGQRTPPRPCHLALLPAKSTGGQAASPVCRDRPAHCGVYSIGHRPRRESPRWLGAGNSPPPEKTVVPISTCKVRYSDETNQQDGTSDPEMGDGTTDAFRVMGTPFLSTIRPSHQRCPALRYRHHARTVACCHWSSVNMTSACGQGGVIRSMPSSSPSGIRAATGVGLTRETIASSYTSIHQLHP